MDRRTFQYLSTPTRRQPRSAKTPGMLRTHTCRRLLSRFQLDVSGAALREVEEMIRANKAHLLAQESCNRSCWMVAWRGETLFFIYDRVRGAVATCMTEEMVRNNFPRANWPSSV